MPGTAGWVLGELQVGELPEITIPPSRTSLAYRFGGTEAGRASPGFECDFAQLGVGRVGSRETVQAGLEVGITNK